jgi:hypothetical protein
MAVFFMRARENIFCFLVEKRGCLEIFLVKNRGRAWRFLVEIASEALGM